MGYEGYEIEKYLLGMIIAFSIGLTIFIISFSSGGRFWQLDTWADGINFVGYLVAGTVLVTAICMCCEKSYVPSESGFDWTEFFKQQCQQYCE